MVFRNSPTCKKGGRVMLRPEARLDRLKAVKTAQELRHNKLAQTTATGLSDVKTDNESQPINGIIDSAIVSYKSDCKEDGQKLLSAGIIFKSSIIDSLKLNRTDHKEILDALGEIENLHNDKCELIGGMYESGGFNTNEFQEEIKPVIELMENLKKIV